MNKVTWLAKEETQACGRRCIFTIFFLAIHARRRSISFGNLSYKLGVYLRERYEITETSYR